MKTITGNFIWDNGDVIFQPTDAGRWDLLIYNQKIDRITDTHDDRGIDDY